MKSAHAGNGHLRDFTTDPRVLLIAAIAVVVATAGLFAGIVLLKLIRLATNIAYFGQFTLAELRLEDTPLGLAAVLVPVIGALIIGLMARFGSEKIRGHGIPEAIEAILLGRSRLDAKVAVLKPLSSAISIGSGGPFGAEGPIIMTGGAIGSLIAQMLPVSDNERKTLLVAGAAAGMTTVFGTPIAAIMLAVELLLFEWTPRSFIPVAVAAIVAEVERTLLHLPSTIFPFSGTMEASIAGLGGWVLVGIAAGLLSGLLTQLVYACEDAFLKLPIHWMWWPMIGGLVVGIGGLIEPHALGVGYDNIANMLDGRTVATAALLLLVVKAVIWSVALGSGTSGGVLAPLLIMGGAMGAVLSGILPEASPGIWPLLAMAATMGGTMRAPLTATFFATELTGNTHVLVPLIAACATAHAVTVLLMKRSILTEKVARRGHHIIREYRVDPFALTRVREVMTSKVESVPATMTLHGAATFLTAPDTRHPSFPVIDEAGHVLGVIDPPAILRWRRNGKHRNATLGELLAGSKITLAYPDEYLEALSDKLLTANVSHLPVVSRKDERLVGYIGWKDMMRVRSKKQAEERERTALLSFGAKRKAQQSVGESAV
ncbi:chloride channel protein [Mesorhizobium sp. M2D.F.Ca.ET.185.01.1.1]|uniref:chloride channel protein n=2 Tax=Mesorhizobium TaxID=68287 RepID=UPI000FCAE2B8|nr:MULTISPECIES: chloride channel protein [unclassified Mesorhizobium]TGP77397.1 chloride channel protein [bacterium M00.F.Ca.ET.227.01.1.1]TGP93192.1 chloride channel protein [bacterium M00.F.Ca.ET.222.01.1.1]TGP96738.1 chloride channel protein [bacterium M00.F.Ca.ET.221.01.1.1]TGU21155.1 chloride channel protein [bacterium M00.F.Ca.ET.156.01.1.1]TGU49950.1 chloride channel protein [bacterium M00.F.Ca.ET.146.01.1.1]TGV68815.1 chloride channel protein [Mesorhizobium sp. M2D.F.Ca.ET.160.01.1.1